MADETDTNKPPHLTLIQGDIKRPSTGAMIACENVASHLEQLTANLLRVIAGSGRPREIMTDLRETYMAYTEYVRTAEVAGEPVDIDEILGRLDMGRYFESSCERPDPRADEDWAQWVAEGEAPENVYARRRTAILLGLRRSVIRELAAVIAGNNAQSSMHTSNIANALNEEMAAREKLQRQQSERSKPSRETLEKMEAKRQHRRQYAELIKQKQRDQDRIVEQLELHHLSTLRAVATKNLEIDRSTLNALGRMGLAARHRSMTGKPSWKLTDLGRRALEVHGIKPTQGERQ